MAANASSVAARAHPSPYRGRAGLLTLLFAVFGGPVAWFAQLVVNYALGSLTCFPGDMPRTELPPGARAIWLAMIVINIVAILVAVGAALLSRRVWRDTRQEHAGSAGELLEAGEGRTRFLAVCGEITGLGFAAAIIFGTVALLVLPQCPG